MKVLGREIRCTSECQQRAARFRLMEGPGDPHDRNLQFPKWQATAIFSQVLCTFFQIVVFLPMSGFSLWGKWTMRSTSRAFISLGLFQTTQDMSKFSTK